MVSCEDLWIVIHNTVWMSLKLLMWDELYCSVPVC